VRSRFSLISEGGDVGTSRYGVLTAMIFAVAMMSIDQTIVSIAAPTIQRERGIPTEVTETVEAEPSLET
jgi:hypothetical protein